LGRRRKGREWRRSKKKNPEINSGVLTNAGSIEGRDEESD